MGDTTKNCKYMVIVCLTVDRKKLGLLQLPTYLVLNLAFVADWLTMYL